MTPSSQEMESPEIPGGSFDLHGRESIWLGVLKGTGDFPLTGLGLSTFPALSRILYPIVRDGRILDDFSSAHNMVLQSSLDLGLPGAIVVIAIWVAAIRSLFLVLTSSPSLSTRSLALGWLGGLTAQLYYQITDSIPLGAKAGLLWWIVIGLGVSLVTDSPNSGAAVPSRIGPLEMILLWLLFSLIAVLTVGAAPQVGVAVSVAAGCVLGWGAIKPPETG